MPGDWSLDQQDVWIKHYLPMILSKHAVQAVVWNQLSDKTPHEWAHGGLIDSKGKPKPALASLGELRRTYID